MLKLVYLNSCKMKKILLFIVMALVSVTNVMAQGESKNMRTIYIWDLTLSMDGLGFAKGAKTPKVYPDVEQVLISDIRAYAEKDGEKRDVVIVPFQERVLTEYVMKIDGCTPEKVNWLVNELQNKGPYCMYKVKHKNTNISDALEYATQNYQDANRQNRIVLLTDGEQNVNGGMDRLRNVVLEWDKEQARKLSEDKLFYILTTENAPSPVQQGDNPGNTKVIPTVEFERMVSGIDFVAEDGSFNLLEEKSSFEVKLICHNASAISGSQLKLAVSTADPNAPLQINEVGNLTLCEDGKTYKMDVTPKCDLNNLRAVLPIGNTKVKLNVKLEPSEIAKPSDNGTYSLKLLNECIILSVHNEEQAMLSISIVK